MVSALWLALPATACSYGDTPARRVLILCAACANAGCLAGLPLKRIVQGYKQQQCKLASHCNTARIGRGGLNWGEMKKRSPRMQRIAIDTAVRASWPVQGASDINHH